MTHKQIARITEFAKKCAHDALATIEDRPFLSRNPQKRDYEAIERMLGHTLTIDEEDIFVRVYGSEVMCGPIPFSSAKFLETELLIKALRSANKLAFAADLVCHASALNLTDCIQNLLGRLTGYQQDITKVSSVMKNHNAKINGAKNE